MKRFFFAPSWSLTEVAVFPAFVRAIVDKNWQAGLFFFAVLVALALYTEITYGKETQP